MLKTAIPYVDLRGRTPVDLLRSYPDKARELIRLAKRSYGLASQLASVVAMPFADRRSRAWLERTRNPFLHEIESMADILKVRGVYTLNLSYEWGCTSGAYRTDDTVSLLRVVDWPIPRLGKHTLVVLQSGKAGEFYNITWPGVAGMITGMAPGRFSAALNLAPMRRHHRGFAGDWIKNRLIAEQESGMPPMHLLRQVFEQAKDYASAKEMLMKTPLAVPAIFVMAGLNPGEGCVIERLENAAEAIELSAGQRVSAANHFTSHFTYFGKGWSSREIDSEGRLRQSEGLAGHDFSAVNFGWLQPPILNADTRLCVLADASTRQLLVQGYQGAVPVTEPFILPAVARTQGMAWS